MVSGQDLERLPAGRADGSPATRVRRPSCPDDGAARAGTADATGHRCEGAVVVSGPVGLTGATDRRAREAAHRSSSTRSGWEVGGVWSPDAFEHLQAFGQLLDRWLRRWLRRPSTHAGG